MVWHADTALPAGTDLVVIPGGFSYGDYLRCGAIAARSPIMPAIHDFAAKGGLGKLKGIKTVRVEGTMTYATAAKPVAFAVSVPARVPAR